MSGRRKITGDAGWAGTVMPAHGRDLQWADRVIYLGIRTDEIYNYPQVKERRNTKERERKERERSKRAFRSSEFAGPPWIDLVIYGGHHQNLLHPAPSPSAACDFCVSPRRI